MILSFFRTAHALWGTTITLENRGNVRERGGDRRARRRAGWTTSARRMDDARATRRRVSVDDKPMFGDLIVNHAWCRESIGDLN